MINNKAFSEFKRGDVWFVRFESEDGDGNDKSSVQKKSRPFVIVSCEQNNNCAPTFNCLPISTRQFDHLPVHVYFRGVGDRDQVVMCEQIITLSIDDMKRRGSRFMFSFNVDFMNRIDEALAAQLGLTPRVADMKVLERLINTLAADKEAEMKRKYEDSIKERVSVIADNLAKRFGITLTAEDMVDGVNYRPEQLRYVDKETISVMESTIKDRTTPNADKMIQKPLHNDIKCEDKVDDKKSNKHHRWTIETMTIFVKDYERLSTEEMMSKYNMTKTSISTYGPKFRRTLNNTKNSTN